MEANTIDYVITFCTIAAGLFLLTGAVKNLDWIHNGKRSTLLIDHEGEKRRRIAVGILGAVLLAAGLFVGYNTFVEKLDFFARLADMLSDK